MLRYLIRAQLLFVQSFLWLLLRPFFQFFIKLSSDGFDNFKKVRTKGLIIALNHLGDADTFLFQGSIPLLLERYPFYYVTLEHRFYQWSLSRNIFFNPLFFWLLGGRQARVGLHNYSLSLATHIELLKEGGTVCIFPEGRRSRNGRIGRAKGGVIALAAETGADIVPVYGHGHYRLSFTDLLLRRRKARFHIFKPITVEELFEGYDPRDFERYEEIAERRIMSVLRACERACSATSPSEVPGAVSTCPIVTPEQKN